MVAEMSVSGYYVGVADELADVDWSVLLDQMSFGYGFNLLQLPVFVATPQFSEFNMYALTVIF